MLTVRVDSKDGIKRSGLSGRIDIHVLSNEFASGGNACPADLSGKEPQCDKVPYILIAEEKPHGKQH